MCVSKKPISQMVAAASINSLPMELLVEVCLFIDLASSKKFVFLSRRLSAALLYRINQQTTELQKDFDHHCTLYLQFKDQLRNAENEICVVEKQFSMIAHQYDRQIFHLQARPQFGEDVSLQQQAFNLESDKIHQLSPLNDQWHILHHQRLHIFSHLRISLVDMMKVKRRAMGTIDLRGQEGEFRLIRSASL